MDGEFRVHPFEMPKATQATCPTSGVAQRDPLISAPRRAESDTSGVPPKMKSSAPTATKNRTLQEHVERTAKRPIPAFRIDYFCARKRPLARLERTARNMNHNKHPLIPSEVEGPLFERSREPATLEASTSLGLRSSTSLGMGGVGSDLSLAALGWRAFEARAGLCRGLEPALRLLHRKLFGDAASVLCVGVRHGAVSHSLAAQRTHAFADVEDMRRG